MARLFLTQRELDFISDITKEVIKDVVGQTIKYYPVSELKTTAHPVYDEALRKIYDNPIVIEALVDNVVQTATTINQFGIDKNYRLEVFIHYRDLVERGIKLSVGDYFTYSDVIFEVTEVVSMRSIYGIVEQPDGMKVVGMPARDGAIDIAIKGPTDMSLAEPDAVQRVFEQQRGFESNSQGPTADHRALVDKGVLDSPLTGPKQVTPAADDKGRNAFYGEDD
jgi:hypothetical protein